MVSTGPKVNKFYLRLLINTLCTFGRHQPWCQSVMRRQLPTNTKEEDSFPQTGNLCEDKQRQNTIWVNMQLHKLFLEVIKRSEVGARARRCHSPVAWAGLHSAGSSFNPVSCRSHAPAGRSLVTVVIWSGWWDECLPPPARRYTS